MMSNFRCMLYQKGIDDVKMLSKSETRNVTIILSFCHFVIFVIFVAKGVEGNACLLEF